MTELKPAADEEPVGSLAWESLTEADRERVRELLDEKGTVAVQALATGGQPLLVSIKEAVEVRFHDNPAPPKRSRAPQVQHWAGDRYTWWQLLAVVGWMRGLVEFPEIGAWRCPNL